MALSVVVRPESSTRSKRRRGLLAAASAVALTCLAVWSLPGDSASGYPVGRALSDGQYGMEVTEPHAQVGKEYWVALPTVENVADDPLTLLGGEITQIPKGLEVTEYKALSHEETQGHPLGPSDVEGLPKSMDLTAMRDHSQRPSRVGAHEFGDVFWAARVRVTGKVTGALKGCRYFYRQGDVEYQQDLSCVTFIRLGAPLKADEK